MNTVEVDHAALVADATAAVARQPVDEPLPDAALAPVPESGETWEETVGDIMPLITLALIPQWGITPKEEETFKKSLAKVLERVFPGGFGGKYGDYLRLAAVTVGIVGGRMIVNGGKLPPFGPKKIIIDEKPNEPDPVFATAA